MLTLGVLSIASGAAGAANSHLGVIPAENMIDVSFIREAGNVTRTLREGGNVSASYSNAQSCFYLTRAFVVTDAQVLTVLQNPAATSFSSPGIYAVHGADKPLMLMTGRPAAEEYAQVEQFQQNFTAGVSMPAGSHICVFGDANAKHNWFEARVSGYYPSK